MEKEKNINPVVCIPIHTSKLNKFEIISIKSHIKQLNKYDIFILIPKSKQKNILNTLKKNDINESLLRFHLVDDFHMKSSDNYQLLLLSPIFYLFYNSYSHILIAQIDAYTFSDQLIKWCESGWDYIGAPCFKYDKYWTNKLLFCGVGGYSLRSIEKTLEVLSINPRIFKLADFLEYSGKYNFKGKIIMLIKFILTKILRKDLLKKDPKNNKFSSKIRNFFIFINEDISYCHYLPRYINSFKVADLEDSRKFCIDWNVKEQLNAISPNLPFGAHAWFTYPENLKIWKQYINEFKEKD